MAEEQKSVSAMNRDELIAHAKEQGIDNPEQLGNMDAIRDAIKVAQKNKEGDASGGATSESGEGDTQVQLENAGEGKVQRGAYATGPVGSTSSPSTTTGRRFLDQALMALYDRALDGLGLPTGSRTVPTRFGTLTCSSSGPRRSRRSSCWKAALF